MLLTPIASVLVSSKASAPCLCTGGGHEGLRLRWDWRRMTSLLSRQYSFVDNQKDPFCGSFAGN